MTAAKFQSIALRLSNAFWCRFWTHWNAPIRDPWLMAISCRDEDGVEPELRGLVKQYGFRCVMRDGRLFHVIDRTYEGMPPG